MKYLIIKFAVLAVLHGCGSNTTIPSAHPAAIFGKDRRQIVTPSAFPFSAVGKLSSRCSGVLVGADLVLTAAHCLSNDIGELRFRHLGPGAEVIVESRARVLAVGTRDSKSNPGSDWAILKLDQPLGNKLGWLGLRKNNSRSLTVNHMGFPGDVKSGNVLAVDFNCRSYAHHKKYLAHDCGTWGGSSGGPLVLREGNQNYVVGIHVLGMNKRLSKYNSQQANLAIPASEFYDELVKHK